MMNFRDSDRATVIEGDAEGGRQAKSATCALAANERIECVCEATEVHATIITVLWANPGRVRTWCRHNQVDQAPATLDSPLRRTLRNPQLHLRDT